MLPPTAHDSSARCANTIGLPDLGTSCRRRRIGHTLLGEKSPGSTQKILHIDSLRRGDANHRDLTRPKLPNENPAISSGKKHFVKTSAGDTIDEIRPERFISILLRRSRSATSIPTVFACDRSDQVEFIACSGSISQRSPRGAVEDTDRCGFGDEPVRIVDCCRNAQLPTSLVMLVLPDDELRTI